MEYVERTIAPVVEYVSSHFKVVLLTGMRQTGKTTLLKHLANTGRKYVSLDNPKTLLLAKTEPGLFFEQYAPPVFIDEVQYAPELFSFIKMIVDNSGENGLIWMTGSQQYSMMKNVSESLAGRAAILDIFGFSIYERENAGLQQKPFVPAFTPPSILRRKSAAETFQVIWNGSFPGLVLDDPKSWDFFYNSYLKTYLERDLRQLVNIGNETSFVKFISVLAAFTAQELNLTNVSDETGISLKTAQNWLSILETSGIVYLLKPYFKGNVAKRFTKKPKLHFMDTGLCAWLTEWKTPQVLEKGAMSGPIFESFVIGEIVKSYRHNGTSASFYYYRENNNIEIDLLISQNGCFFPIEIKKTGNPGKADVAAFGKLAALENTGYGSLICLTPEIYPLTETANAISIWDI